MAVLNIILDFFWGRMWGIIGIFFATTVSRLMTQVWFDPWLVFSRVFKTSVLDYYKDYVIYALITAASCALSYYLCDFLPIGHGIIRFALSMVVCVVIPNVIVLALYHKSEEFHYLRGAISNLLGKFRGRKG
jgi:hypothetical protein